MFLSILILLIAFVSPNKGNNDKTQLPSPLVESVQFYNGLSVKVYNMSDADVIWPVSTRDYDKVEEDFATDKFLLEQYDVQSPDAIYRIANEDAHTLTVVDGFLEIAEAGTYTFYLNGTDAIDLWINDECVAGRYGGHSQAKGDYLVKVEKYLEPGNYSFKIRSQQYKLRSFVSVKWSKPNSELIEAIDNNQLYAWNMQYTLAKSE